MDGFIFFVTILAAFGMGYYNGLKTRRKKIVGENNELKKQNRKLMQEIRRLKTLKYDYQVSTGLFNKKNKSILLKEVQFLIDADQSNESAFVGLFALLDNMPVDSMKVDCLRLHESLRELEGKMDFVTININGNERTIDICEINDQLKKIFNELINIDEYEISEIEMHDALYEVLSEINEKKVKKSKKFSVHSHGTKK